MHCFCRKDEGNSTAVFIDVPVSSLNVQLQGQSGNGGSLRRKRATDLSWGLTGLEEYTTYVVQVLFYTVGNSAYSPPVEIQTAEDGRGRIVRETWGIEEKEEQKCGKYENGGSEIMGNGGEWGKSGGNERV